MATVLTTLAPLSLTAGTATPLSATSIFASTVQMYADTLNTGNVYLGGASLTTATGIPISKNNSQSIDYEIVWGGNGKLDLAKIFFDTDTTGNLVRILYTPWIGG